MSCWNMNFINNLNPQQNSLNFPSEHIPSHIDQLDSLLGPNCIFTLSWCCFEGNMPAAADPEYCEEVQWPETDWSECSDGNMVVSWCATTAASTVQLYTGGQPAICQPNIIHYNTVPLPIFKWIGKMLWSKLWALAFLTNFESFERQGF